MLSAKLPGRDFDYFITQRGMFSYTGLSAAQVDRLREEFGMPGMSVDTVRGFRDKQLMKERVKAAGLRVPHSFRVRSESETRAAAEKIASLSDFRRVSQEAR